MGPMGHGFFWWGGMWIFPLLFLALLILAVYLVVTRGVGPRKEDGTGRDETALEILEKRYARGEISREEFLQARTDLTSSEREPPS